MSSRGRGFIDVMAVECPSCGSKKTEKSSAVYEQGISRSTSTGGGIGVSGSGKLGAFQNRSSTTRISTVAEKNAPPSDGFEKHAIIIVALLVVPTIGAMFLDVGFWDFLKLLIFLVVGAPILAMILVVFLKNGIDESQEQYRQQWYCYTCGAIFQQAE